MTDELRTPRLLLRRWRVEDRAPFAALDADREVMEHSTEHGDGLWAVEAGGAGASSSATTAVRSEGVALEVYDDMPGVRWDGPAPAS